MHQRNIIPSATVNDKNHFVSRQLRKCTDEMDVSVRAANPKFQSLDFLFYSEQLRCLPVTAASHVRVFRSDFKIIEYQGNLFVRCRQKVIGAVRVTGIVAGMSW